MPEVAQDLESSPESDSQDVEVESPSGSEDVAESSMEDAIRSAVGDNVSEDEDAEPSEDEQTDPSSEEVGEPVEGEQPAEIDEDSQFIEMLKKNDVPLGKIERFKELIDERNQFKESTEQLQGIQGQLAEIQMAGQQAGLSQEQLTTLFSIPMMLSKDPQAAFDAIEGLRSFAAEHSGAEIPDDLRQRVEDGYMDEESARELAKARAEAGFNARRAEQVENERQQEAAMQSQSTVIEAVNTFQKSLRETDPDYDHKHKFVKLELAALVKARGAPESPSQAVEWAREAHTQVTKDLGFMKPPKRPARTLSGNGTNRSAAAAPASMFEAISAVVNSTTED